MSNLNHLISFTIQIQNSWLQKAQEYQNKSNQKETYQIRGNYKKIDEINGKIAEEASKQYLETQTMVSNISPVDYQIYDKNHKSYASDLQGLSTNNIIYHFHVKSCKISTTDSWVFQKSDPLCQGIYSDCDFFIPTVIDQNQVIIKGIYRWDSVIHKLKPLFNKNPYKLAIYLQDLQ